MQTLTSSKREKQKTKQKKNSSSVWMSFPAVMQITISVYFGITPVMNIVSDLNW